MLRTLLMVSVVAAPAFASDPYLGFIQTKYTLGAPPPQSCALCHTNGVTGFGTVNTLFGTAMRARGLTGGANTASVGTALDKLAADAFDGDGDGVTDVAELMAGTNPNTFDGTATDGGTGGGGGTTTEVPALKYGCGAAVVPELLLLAALLPLLRRRAR